MSQENAEILRRKYRFQRWPRRARSVLGPLRRGLYRWFRPYLLEPGRDRAEALADEVEWWRRYLSTGGLSWPDGGPDEFDRGLDADAEVFEPALREVLAALPGGEVSVLDVGAGPLTVVGRRFPGKKLKVTPVDPLACLYRRLLAEADLTPPIWTQYGEGERLLEQFGEGAFDVVYARNSIDHVVDPLRVIDNMLAVVRPGGYVVLQHLPNEAVNQAYGQLHQWNFDERGGHLLIWRRRSDETDLTKALADRAEVSCRRTPVWVVGILRRRDRLSEAESTEG